MTSLIIYRLSDGLILRTVSCATHMTAWQFDVATEGAIAAELTDENYVIDGVPVYIAPPEPDPTTLQEVKIAQYAQLEADFNAEVYNGTTSGLLTSLGWYVYDAEEDLSNYERALKSLELTGSSSKVIKIKSAPRLVNATVADLQAIVTELIVHGELLYARKWQLALQLEAATTVEEAQAIVW